MSQKVNAVPDASFSVPPLTTTAGTRVSRRRIRVPCNYPGTKYGHNGQSGLPSVVTFDIADNESFLDMDKSMIVLDFQPSIYHYAAAAQDIHPVGFDGSSQALMARVRIGNSQGLIIEELQAYGTWANIMDSYSHSEEQVEHHLLDQSTSRHELVPLAQKTFGSSIVPTNFQHAKNKKLYLRFKHSSFLKSCRMIPLFLMRNGLRFEIEFEDVYKCFTRNLEPLWLNPIYANQFGHDLTLPLTHQQVVTRADYYFVQNCQTTDNTVLGQTNQRSLELVVKQGGQLAKALNLKSIIQDNFRVSIEANNAVVNGLDVGGARYWSGSFAIPLKFEYTDELGTEKVLLQGIFQLLPDVYMATKNTTVPPAVAVTNSFDFGFGKLSSAQAQYFLLSEGTQDAGYDWNLRLDAFDEAVYVLRFCVPYEGFKLPFIKASTDVDIFVPYFKSLRCYPTSDIVPVFGFNRFGESVESVLVYRPNDAFNGLTNITLNWNEDSQIWSQPNYCSYSIGKAKWDYNASNIEMICDFVKPSSEVFLQFQQSFQAPAGIPYAYKRVLYHTRVLNNPDGLQQISLPVSVRSLRGIVCVISDKLAWSRSQDNSSKSFNSLSAFMKRGLIRAQLVIGGQNYPSYDLNLTENGVEQIPELECLFNVAGLGSFNPSFDKKELLSTRNYAIGLGVSGSGGSGSGGQYPFDGVWTEQPYSEAENVSIQQYHDTSKFVLGISTMKKDGDFVTGVDTSQAGSVSLNLFFKKQKDVSNMYPGDMGGGRDVFVQIYSLADAVFTLQNDANLVRY